MLVKTTIQAELPPDLVDRAGALVREGWAGGFGGLPAEALRQYLESH